MADHAEAMARSDHPGWAPTAWDGLQQTLELLNERRIKVIINGGALNPKGLAEKTLQLVRSPFKSHSPKVAQNNARS